MSNGLNLNNDEPAAPGISPSACACGTAELTSEEAVASEPEQPASHLPAPPPHHGGVRPSAAHASVGGNVYALGVLSYDFGTEARRDSFKQLMPSVSIGDAVVSANPFDARQMSGYLKDNLPESRSLIWTLNLELTPIYAIEPAGPFAREVYQLLQQVLEGQIQPSSSQTYIERISMPGRLTGRSVRLFSGQVIPVVEMENTRGMYGWNVNALQDAAVAAVKKEMPAAEEHKVRDALAAFLNRVYHNMRNLGQTSRQRALNFTATNAFQVANVFGKAIGAGMELEDIDVARSPHCRVDSDCWDVTLKFFDPENVMRGRKHFQFTIDVGDLIPVTVGEIRSWSGR